MIPFDNYPLPTVKKKEREGEIRGGNWWDDSTWN